MFYHSTQIHQKGLNFKTALTKSTIIMQKGPTINQIEYYIHEIVANLQFTKYFCMCKPTNRQP